MSIQSNFQIIKDSLLESKEIINEIFTALGLSEENQLEYMTFAQLNESLYKILNVIYQIVDTENLEDDDTEEDEETIEDEETSEEDNTEEV